MRPILCFGEALIDFHAERSESFGVAHHFVPFAGGAPAKGTVAATRLGGNARFAGMLSQDPFGDFLLDSLRRAGVGAADVVRTYRRSKYCAGLRHPGCQQRAPLQLRS